MKILAFVEGEGEQSALPTLLNRLHREACVHNEGRWNEPMIPLPPWKVGLDKLSDRTPLQKKIRDAFYVKDFDALLILVDADDVCPRREIAARISWVGAACAGTPFAYVFAYREYESWFLASMESLRGIASIRPDAVSLDNPEEPRGAKERIEACMLLRRATCYRETTHQKLLTASFDMASAYRACRSFRKLVKAFGDLYRVHGKPIPHWPPSTW